MNCEELAKQVLFLIKGIEEDNKCQIFLANQFQRILNQAYEDAAQIAEGTYKVSTKLNNEYGMAVYSMAGSQIAKAIRERIKK